LYLLEDKSEKELLMAARAEAKVVVVGLPMPDGERGGRPEPNAQRE